MKTQSEEKTHWKKNFNYNYLGSYSLEENQEVTLTIFDVKKEVVKSTGGRKEDCTVAYFKEAVGGEKKPMILNKTNCKIIEKLYGTPYIEDWKGKQITIFVQDGIEAFGELVDALRVKQIIPVKKKYELKPGCDKWESAKVSVKTNGSTFESINKHYLITQENFDLLCS